MATLSKKTSLYARDEQGELIPQERALVIDEKSDEQKALEGTTVWVIPMTRGEIKKMYAELATIKDEKDMDGNLILKYCKNPAFNEEEVKVLKPAVSTAIVNTILQESGLELKTTKKSAIDRAEDDFAKN